MSASSARLRTNLIANICSAAVIFYLPDLNSQSVCRDVSTFYKAQKCSRETPKQSSKSPLPNSAIRVTASRNSHLFATAVDLCTRWKSKQPWNVCYWHKADISRLSSDVRFWG